MGDDKLKGFDGIDDFRELVEEIRSLPLKERREAFGELFRLCVHPLVERARSEKDVSEVLSLLEQTWRIGFEAGVIDGPPRSTHSSTS